jgi:sigma54-dependent transcription regulator
MAGLDDTVSDTLFGHVRGAYRRGRANAAWLRGVTVHFLDEIGD